MKSILVSTDASPASNRSIDLAADMAAKYHATLHLLYVVRDMQLPPELKKMQEVEKIAGQRIDVLTFVGEKILSDAEARAKKKGASKIKTFIGQGDPASAILEYAKKHSADLIVLGTRGLGQVQGMFLGSVSRKVTNLSEVDCLVVR